MQESTSSLYYNAHFKAIFTILYIILSYTTPNTTPYIMPYITPIRLPTTPVNAPKHTTKLLPYILATYKKAIDKLILLPCYRKQNSKRKSQVKNDRIEYDSEVMYGLIRQVFSVLLVVKRMLLHPTTQLSPASAATATTTTVDLTDSLHPITTTPTTPTSSSLETVDILYMYFPVLSGSQVLTEEDKSECLTYIGKIVLFVHVCVVCVSYL